MRSRELSLWWSEGVCKRGVKDKRGMDRRRHECADIYAHENEEKRDIDERARVECVLVHRHRQQDGILASREKHTVIRFIIENTLWKS